MRSADFIGQCLSSGAKRKTCAHSEFFGFRPRLCENSDVELARRKFVSITLNNKRTALAVAVERRKERKQFCAFSARARFHTAWTLSGLWTVGGTPFECIRTASVRFPDVALSSHVLTTSPSISWSAVIAGCLRRANRRSVCGRISTGASGGKPKNSPA